MFVSYPAKLGHIFTEGFDPLKFLSLLLFGKFGMVDILQPPACIDPDCLELSSGSG